MSALESLPPKLLLEIIKHLPPRAIINLGLAYKDLKKFFQHEEVLQSLFKKYSKHLDSNMEDYVALLEFLKRDHPHEKKICHLCLQLHDLPTRTGDSQQQVDEGAPRTRTLQRASLYPFLSSHGSVIESSNWDNAPKDAKHCRKFEYQLPEINVKFLSYLTATYRWEGVAYQHEPSDSSSIKLPYEHRIKLDLQFSHRLMREHPEFPRVKMALEEADLHCCKDCSPEELFQKIANAWNTYFNERHRRVEFCLESCGCNGIFTVAVVEVIIRSVVITMSRTWESDE
ncbi:hypothetical protein BU24DRAFT_415720 [Aaosphaeria arxii CBS 175.79]|uniref:F-box domain-containing protein n=1 Tax=Aaosphaeria arxii CBS 175.79 TaxID=1450172 RepID=A0A6A5X772_9PLEO|nr:uncharacterized protein BU24DRAFT_415720 [Aaosphaeria arxii CBS 175.79]KAF2008667.1 hypothetical protein BU24DRAFT_415720 [Aaosphaeria arxii CBS 175.79]